MHCAHNYYPGGKSKFPNTTCCKWLGTWNDISIYLVSQTRCTNLQNDYMYKYCFTSLSVQSWQYRERRKPEAGTMSHSSFEWLQGFFIVRSTIGSTVHSMPLDSLEHCICKTTMTNIRPDRDSNLVPQVTSPSRYKWAIGAGLQNEY